MVRLGTAAAAFAALSVVALLVSSPTRADDDELALAREYWKLHAIMGGYAEPKPEVLEDTARNLIRYCAETPAAQMPRAKLETAKILMVGRWCSGGLISTCDRISVIGGSWGSCGMMSSSSSRSGKRKAW